MRPGVRLRRLHFVGIGGAGMSALAEVLAAWGFAISGSDGQASEALERLRGLGITVEVGHRAANLCEADAVVRSSAVPLDNPELERARQIGIPVVRRAEMLGEAMKGKYGLAVAGTHGKTTTTAMLGRIWREAGRDPTIVAGGSARGENLSAVAGHGEAFIVEADEFDRSFLCMEPAAALVGNIDSDHLDCYGTEEAVRDAFVAFSEKLPFYGLMMVNHDDAGVRAVLPRLSRKTATFGLSQESDYRAVAVRATPAGAAFALERRGEKLGEIALRVPGAHNVYNALGAAALSLEEGLPFEAAARGLEGFQGIRRRMEYRGEKQGVTFYDDYAHHPTETAAALRAARDLTSGRLVAVFQPHLYSRTQQLFQEFARAFKACDLLFVTRVYPAREASIPGVEGHLITDAAGAFMDASRIRYVEDPEALPQLVAKALRPGDLVLTMGAGDIGSRNALIMEAMS